MIFLGRRRKIQRVQRVFFASFFAVALVAVFFLANAQKIDSPVIPQEVSASNEVLPPPVVVSETQAAPAVAISKPVVIDDGKIHASAAFSTELESGRVLFSQNAQKKLPIASLTKLMTALVVLDQYDLGYPVTISAEAMAQEGSQGNLKAGQVLSVKDLLYILLMESSNRSAYALAQVMGVDAFVAAMNVKAQSSGLLDTHFADSSGLSLNSYSTAKDVAQLSGYLFTNYPLFREIIGLKEFNLYLPDGALHHKLVTTNQLLGQLDIVGGKTGWTAEARGCFMVIRQVGQTHTINVILGAEDRFLEMKKLINQ